MRRTVALLALPLVLLVGSGISGCKCDPNGENCELRNVEPNDPAQAPRRSIRIWSGDNQIGPVGQVLAEEIVAEVRAHGNLDRDLGCDFSIGSGGGSLQRVGEPASDGRIKLFVGSYDGYCRAVWRLGGTTGVNTVNLSANTPVVGPPNLVVTFTARGYGPAAKFEIREGDAQAADPGQPLPIRPRVRVTDAGDNPVPGVNVVFVAQPGSGTPGSPVSVPTNNLGDATLSVDWVLGSTPGTQYLQAVAGDLGSPLGLTGNPALFSATARAAPAPLLPARIDIVEGDNQNTIAGSPVPLPVRVRVTSASGEPVPGVLVDFVPDRGSVDMSPATTFADGIATPGTWRPGFNEAGTFHLTATARGASIANNPVLFTATVSIGQGGTNSLQFYNGTNVAANIILDSESPAPSNSLGPSGTRDVQIFTAINTSVAVLAYIGGSQVASARCTVTAAAWQGGTRPLVALFSDGRYILTCSNF